MPGVGLHAQEGRQSQAVRQVQIEHDYVRRWDVQRGFDARPQPSQRVGQCMHDLQLERLVAGQSQLLPEQVLVLDVRIDQQHGCRHAIQEYIAASTTSTAAMARG